MIEFKKWLNEVGGATGIVLGNPCKLPKLPDAQYEGDPLSSCRKKTKNNDKTRTSK